MTFLTTIVNSTFPSTIRQLSSDYVNNHNHNDSPILVTTTAVPPLSSMAMIMLFGTVIVCTVAMTIQSILGTDDIRLVYNTIIINTTRSKPFNIQSYTSIYTLLYNTSVLGFIMLYAYLCEHYPIYPHGEKSYNRDQFFFLTALLIVVSIYTIKRNDGVTTTTTTTNYDHTNNKDTTTTTVATTATIDPSSVTASGTTTTSASLLWKKTLSVWQQEKPVVPIHMNDSNEILNRDQTEEWKGWMQFMFLLYHYYKAEEVYNCIRIMITCYVWMTGFGNFSFFYIKDDYSIIRVLQMIWRLNFLVLIICFTQGTTYILYYICLLHTYYFGMVFVVMRILKNINYTKYGVRIKLMLLAMIIFCIWDVDTGIFQWIHTPFLGGKVNSEHPILGATSGSMWEWYFRSSLDHWSTLLGMIFALNFPITSYFIRYLEAQPIHYHVGAKGLMGIVLLLATFLWCIGPYRLNKFEYNQTNAYFGIVPVLTYIYFRNLTPWLRNHTLDLLHQIGKTTLETYLMQHHIWLTSNAKSLLILIPGWPMMNFLLVTTIYICMSRRLYTITLFIRGMILPNNNLKLCLYNLSGMMGTISFYLGFAYVLRSVGLLNYYTAIIISIIFGTILYTAILNRTWDAFVIETSNHSTTNTASSGSASASTSIMNTTKLNLPLYIGGLFMLLIGMACRSISFNSAGMIRPLTIACDHAVQQIKWFPVDRCNEMERGDSYRNYDVATIGSCSATTWGWDITPLSSSHCRFTHRDAKVLLRTLQHRNITFVGDSIIRHLFHATCRQVGDLSAGSYNTSTEKWSDFTRQYGNKINMTFHWAPYVANLTDVVDAIGLEHDKPDLLILGGGAWDRLHTYNTETEQEVLQFAVTTLIQKLKRLKTEIPIAWVVPTTINSWALTSDEKKENIREDQMVLFREIYHEVGLDEAVTFVLDGTKFTSGVTEESYDGVHYPFYVYDAGAQILANAMDWLLLEPKKVDPFTPPKVGSMDNPLLGLMMLLFVAIGLFSFDGYLGVSYVCTVLLPQLTPLRLYHLTFRALHLKNNLPVVPNDQTMNGTEMTPSSQHHHHSSEHEDEESERQRFLNK